MAEPLELLFSKSNLDCSYDKQIVVGYVKRKCSHLNADWDFDTFLHINTIYTAKSMALIRTFETQDKFRT